MVWWARTILPVSSSFGSIISYFAQCRTFPGRFFCSPYVVQARIWATLVVVLLFCIQPAHAMQLRMLETPTEQLYREAKAARLGGHLEQADALLMLVESAQGKLSGRLLWERALLARDRGQTEEALHELNLAIELDAPPGASIELAAILTSIGRWPEAVEALRLRVDHDLTPEQLLSEKRLAPLTAFAPYKELLSDLRQSRLGPVGALRGRLSDIENSARSIERSINRVSTMVEGVVALLESKWTRVFIFLFMLFTVAAGIYQMQLIQKPWTLLVAFVLCAIIWRAAAGIVSGAKSSGEDTIYWGAYLGLGPAALGVLWRSGKMMWVKWQVHKARKD